MRRLAAAPLAALALVGAAQAQPHGVYFGWGEYAYRYAPPLAYGPDGRYTPYVWPNGYDGFHPPPLGDYDACAAQAAWADARPCGASPSGAGGGPAPLGAVSGPSPGR